MYIKETLTTLIKLTEDLNKFDWINMILKNSNGIKETFNIFFKKVILLKPTKEDEVHI